MKIEEKNIEIKKFFSQIHFDFTFKETKKQRNKNEI
jgi:hypothetical protein